MDIVSYFKKAVEEEAREIEELEQETLDMGYDY
jgi:hypothetical protein